jgi:hypothetical protein
VLFSFLLSGYVLLQVNTVDSVECSVEIDLVDMVDSVERSVEIDVVDMVEAVVNWYFLM